MSSETIILIPARLESSRFPGKALAPVNGIPMIVRCAQNAKRTNIKTVVCTDSELIKDVCSKYEINTIITPKFKTGTDRVEWAAGQLKPQTIINLQGDEVLVTTKAILKFADELKRVSETDDKNLIINGISQLNAQKAFDRNNVKTIISDDNKIMYLSRKPLRNTNSPDKMSTYLKQIGLYGFTIDALQKFSKMPQSRLEITESVEMLRWIENGNRLEAVLLDTPSISVDTPEDLVEAEEFLQT